MSYQTCPKCKGTGKKYNPVATGNVWLDAACNISPMSIPYLDKEGNLKMDKPDNSCPVCKGKTIISESTGRPPND